MYRLGLEKFLQNCLIHRKRIELYIKYNLGSSRFFPCFNPNRSLDELGQERPERGGPCWLFKLRQMGNLRVHMVGCLGSSCCYDRFLSCCGCSSQPSTKFNIFLTAHVFTFLVPIAQQPGAGSRAGSPVSVSLLSGLDASIRPLTRSKGGKHKTRVDCFANHWLRTT